MKKEVSGELRILHAISLFTNNCCMNDQVEYKNPQSYLARACVIKLLTTLPKG